MPELASAIKKLVKSLLPEAEAGILNDPSASKKKPKAPSTAVSREASLEPANEEQPANGASPELEEDLTRQSLPVLIH